MVEFSEDDVGKPVLGTNTMIFGTVTAVESNALVVEKDPGADPEVAGVALLSSGDGEFAVMPGQVEKVTEDGVFLADPSEIGTYDDLEIVQRPGEETESTDGDDGDAADAPDE